MPVQVSLHSVALLPPPSLLLAPAGLFVHVSFSPALTSPRIKSGFSLPLAVTWPSLITLLPQFPPALTSAVCSSSFYFLSVRISDAKTFGSFKPLYCVPLWYKQPWTLPKCYWTDATLCYISLTELHNGGCMLSRADSNQEELLSSTCQRYWNKVPLMGSVSEF